MSPRSRLRLVTTVKHPVSRHEWSDLLGVPSVVEHDEHAAVGEDAAQQASAVGHPRRDAIGARRAGPAGSRGQPPTPASARRSSQIPGGSRTAARRGTGRPPGGPSAPLGRSCPHRPCRRWSPRSRPPDRLPGPATRRVGASVHRDRSTTPRRPAARAAAVRSGPVHGGGGLRHHRRPRRRHGGGSRRGHAGAPRRARPPSWSLKRSRVLPVDLERLGLSASLIERAHEVAAKSFAVRIVGDESDQRGHDVVRCSSAQPGLGPLLDHDDALLLQAPGLDLEHRTAGQIAKGGAGPEPQRGAEVGEGAIRVAGAQGGRTAGAELAEGMDVEHIARHEGASRWPGRDPLRRRSRAGGGARTDGGCGAPTPADWRPTTRPPAVWSRRAGPRWRAARRA